MHRNSLDDELRAAERALEGSPRDHALQDSLDRLRMSRFGPLEARDELELWSRLWRMIRRARHDVPRRGVDLSGFRQTAIRAIRTAVTEGLRSPVGVSLVEVFRCERCHRVSRTRTENRCGECAVSFCRECENEGPAAHSGYHARCRGEYFTTWIGAAAYEDAMRRVTICLRAQDRPLGLGWAQQRSSDRPPEGSFFPELTTRAGLSAPGLDRVTAARSLFCIDPAPPGEDPCVFPPPLVRMVSLCEMLHRWDGKPVGHQCWTLPVEALRAEVRGDGEQVLRLVREISEGEPFIYELGDLFLEGLTCNERTSTGHAGEIEIGGDRGDVLGREATERGEGVLLHDARLRTTELGLRDETAKDWAREIVENAFSRIGNDTFRQYHRER